jgi:ribonuclease III
VNPAYDTLQQALGHRFKDAQWLERALTHRSASSVHNERLEFLGDAVLSATSSTLLMQRFEGASEGDLTRMRSQLVREECLHAVALNLNLQGVLRLSEGEAKGGGATRASILADAVEALIGAVYTDAGYAAALKVTERLLGPSLDAVDPKDLNKDPKTDLQERLQAKRMATPTYRVDAKQGQAHAQTFEVVCTVEALALQSRGRGLSRKAAEQEAARAMIELWIQGARPNLKAASLAPKPQRD